MIDIYLVGILLETNSWDIIYLENYYIINSVLDYSVVVSIFKKASTSI